jgi:hypothetical protein
MVCLHENKRNIIMHIKRGKKERNGWLVSILNNELVFNSCMTKTFFLVQV